jgi:hypothetical protein
VRTGGELAHAIGNRITADHDHAARDHDLDIQGGPEPGDPGENVVLRNPRPGVAIDELGNVVETK